MCSHFINESDVIEQQSCQRHLINFCILKLFEFILEYDNVGGIRT